MTAILFFWVAEFALEAFGALLNRKRVPLLACVLAFCALSDAVTFCIFWSADPVVYGTSYWASRCLKYLLLIWLACSICGMFVSDNRKSVTILSAAVLSVGSAAIITAVGTAGETLKSALLDGEIAANMILLGMVAVGWISRRGKLNQAWKWIAAGFLIMVGSDLLFTALWMVWDGARHWYPLGAIAAQLIWVIGAMRPFKIKEFNRPGEAKQSLGHQITQVEKVRMC